MRNIRVYTETPMAVSTTAVLSKEASHHLLRVLRCRRNDRITLFNGLGGCYTGRIVSGSTRAVEVEILDFQPDRSTPGLLITLGLGISRSLHMDFAVQKTVELGVHAIVPLFAERSNVKLDRERTRTRMEHWRKIIIHACEQSGRNTLPVLDGPHGLNEWVSGDRNPARFVLAPAARQTLAGVTPDGRQASILVGPEGGLTGAETARAEEQGYVPVRLGPRILRTETAAVAAVTVLQVLWGDLR